MTNNCLDNMFQLKQLPDGDFHAILSSTGLIPWHTVQQCIKKSGTPESKVSSIRIDNGFLNVDKPLDGEHVKKISGRFQISGTRCGVFMPQLERVFGPVDLNSTGKLSLPRLNSVGGALHIASPTDLPSLILVNDGLSYEGLSYADRSVDGLYLPSLVGIGGDIAVPGARVRAPQLRFLGGRTSLSRTTPFGALHADFYAPLLESHQMGRARAIDATLDFCRLRNQRAEECRQATADLESDWSSVGQGPLL